MINSNFTINASLTIVGVGIKFLSHLTIEAKAYIEQSDKVLYLVNNPIMHEWLKQANANAEALDSLYLKYPLRVDCYRAISDYILQAVKENQHVCVVLYGHPTVFAQPALEAARQAKKEGYVTKILPGISAEDCLFADLMIDPATFGCQSFEATDFLIHRRKFDSTCHLILWQIDVIGELGHAKKNKGLTFLVEYLKGFYPANHEVILYEAAQFPHFDPKITPVSLAKLLTAPISSVTTLYVPPACKANIDHDTLNSLEINLSDFAK